MTLFGFKSFFNPHPRICLLILEREEMRERERKRNIDVRNSNQLPPIHTPAGNQT